MKKRIHLKISRNLSPFFLMMAKEVSGNIGAQNNETDKYTNISAQCKHCASPHTALMYQIKKYL